MEVGPSAPPMMPMEPASCALKPSIIAPSRATKTPNCAAAPMRRLDGRAIKGPKSVIAPTPRKMSGGKISYLMPMPMADMTPGSSNPLNGTFARMQPKAIGLRSSGSKSRANAR